VEVKTSGICLLGLSLLAACAPAADETSPDPQALVTLADVRPQEVGQTVTLYGAADAGPGTKVSIVAPIEARLVSIVAPVGSSVRKGQVIVRLLPGPMAAVDIAKARSDAQLANAAYARAVRMRADGLMSNAEVETSRAAKTAAGATLVSLTGQNLALRAPLAGYVESITAMPGEIVPAGNAVGSISGNGAVRARFGIDPLQASSLRPGAPVWVSGGSALKIETRLTAVDPTVDPQTKLASAYAMLPGGGEWRAGQSLTGEVTISASGQALAMPYGALLDDGGQPFVFVVSKGVANRRDVVTGPTDGSTVAVTKGLSAGDKVVIAGGTALEDGMKVRLK
jgi:RND family efflux transporter MFP subunit